MNWSEYCRDALKARCGSLRLVGLSLVTAFLLCNISSAHGHGLTRGERLASEFLHQRLLEYDRVPLESHRAVSAHPDHRKLQEDAAPEPLRVLIHYDEDHIELEPHEYDALATRLGPLLTAVIETTFSVLRPDAGPSLLLPRRCLSSWSDGTCSEVAPIGTCLAATPPPSFYGPATTCSNGPSSSPRICDTVAGGEGAGDYNFVLFVTATDSIGGESTCDGEVFALGAPCELSVVDGHPVAGSINICPNAIRERGVGDASLGRQLDILVHETLHTLGVTGWMIPRYVDAAGVPLGESRTLWSDESGRKWLVTPRMRQSAREHFGCDTMPGMPLEDDGGAGTAVSHFEMATVGNELMSGSSEGDRMLLSVFSMSQMEDTGWYAPDWSQARKMSHGRGGGCEWVYAQCHGGLVNCTPDQTNTLVPSDDHHKYGSCQPMQLESECMDVVVTEQGSCYDAFNNTARSGRALISYGAKSRAFKLKNGSVWEAAVVAKTWPDPAVCLETICGDDGQSLSVVVNGKRVKCPAGKSVVMTWQFVGLLRGTIVCPAQDVIESILCPGLSCPADCSGAGTCVEGECQCFLGRTGPDCAGWLLDLGVVEPGVYGPSLAQKLLNLAAWWSWILVLSIIIAFLALLVWLGIRLTRSQAEDEHLAPLSLRKKRADRARLERDRQLARKVSQRMGVLPADGRGGGRGGKGGREAGQEQDVETGHRRDSTAKATATGRTRPLRHQASGNTHWDRVQALTEVELVRKGSQELMRTVSQQMGGGGGRRSSAAGGAKGGAGKSRLAAKGGGGDARRGGREQGKRVEVLPGQVVGSKPEGKAVKKGRRTWGMDKE